MNKLTIGDYINWVEPKKAGEHNSCTQCGRKVGKTSYWVQISTTGAIVKDMPFEQSQGYWAVGSECAKQFDLNVLIKAEAK